MATVLTKSYQRIATISLTYGEIRTYAKYTSQSTVNNKTTYYLKSTYYIPSQSYIRFSSATAKLDGTSKSYGSTTLNKGETTIQEVSRTITHNSDGSSPTKSVKTEWSATFGGSGTSTASISMPKINRIATVTSASDFTDEENPTLKFSNPAGFIVYPYLNFYDKDNNLVHQLIRNSESITSPYTWNITNEERTALYKATNKQQTYKVNIGVDTYNGATKLGSNSKSQTMTYVNAEPSQTTLFTEIKQKVIDVLGTNTAETLIQNASKVTLESTPEVKKEATVSKILFEHNNLSTEDKESPYGIMLDVVNSKFKVTIVDSRGYSIPTEYTKSIIQYTPINIDSFSFKRENPTSSNIKLNAQIRYKQATFGTTENVPTIKWKLGTDGTLNTLTTSDYTIDIENDKITISNLVLENVLPYTSEGRFYLYVNDLLTEDTENEPVTRGTPTCDMGEHDFQVNGDLFIADINRQNPINVLEKINQNEDNITFLKTQKILWQGVWYMTAGHTVDLSKTPISEQPNGIVLLFSAYENNEAQDYNWHSFFIPKAFIETHSGNGILFPMFTQNFGAVGNKYLYISDTRITGHANNTATGTGSSGITYKNNYWVLRYVIGV